MEWRYIAEARRVLASEQGVRVSDWGGQVPIVLAYPNSYAVGMSSLAMHGLYRWFNELPGAVCERAFASLSRDKMSAATPPITLESQRPIQDAAMLAFSVSFELDYFNLVAMLRRAGIPLRADERGRGDPFVVLGGPAVSANPEPLAALADAIVIGEAEALIGDLVDVLRDSAGQERRTTLSSLARLPGVYVPMLHACQAVQRQWVRNLDEYPLATSVIAPQAEFGDMYLIEISRGCGHGCRFCLAGYWYRPPRQRSPELILRQAREGLQYRKKIGLVAAAVSDYVPIDDLVRQLRQMGAEISISSLRVAPLSRVLIQALAEGGSRSITFAPEAGSQRLREKINKCVSHDAIIAATESAAQHGFEMLKLYFMLGLPGESDEDVQQMIALIREIKGVFARQVVVNLTPFVPKAHTPFQRAGMAPSALLEERLARIRAALRPLRVEVRAEGVDAARAQGVLARGDRRIGDVLLAMKHPSVKQWQRALQRQGIVEDEYLRARAAEEPLPWDFIRSGIARAYMDSEARRSEEGVTTAACLPTECGRCGVCASEELS